jgi:hypothetical protein
VDWNQDYIGTATVKVKGENNCGEGLFSEGFEVIVDICGNVAENTSHPFSIYPNPAKRWVTITNSWTNDGMVKLSVLDQLGETILPVEEFKTSEKSLIILNVENLKPGVYFLVIINNHKIQMEKLIIR